MNFWNFWNLCWNSFHMKLCCSRSLRFFDPEFFYYLNFYIWCLVYYLNCMLYNSFTIWVSDTEFECFIIFFCYMKVWPWILKLIYVNIMWIFKIWIFLNQELYMYFSHPEFLYYLKCSHRILLSVLNFFLTWLFYDLNFSIHNIMLIFFSTWIFFYYLRFWLRI